MKKFLSVLVACVLCLLMTGCPAKMTEEEKAQLRRREWENSVGYDYFKLDTISMWGGSHENTNFGFLILSSDNIQRDTIAFHYESDEVSKLNTNLQNDPVTYIGEYFTVVATFETIKVPAGVTPKNIPFTLRYTATDGRTVSKDYILDFTQTPFWDYRTGTGLYKP